MKRYIKSNIDLQFDEIYDLSLNEREKLARETTDERTLILLSRDTSSDVRRYVAWNTSTPEKALRRLADDDDTFVMNAVASNPSTPEDLLVELLNCNCLMVVDTAARNSHTPIDALKQRKARHINDGYGYDYIVKDIDDNLSKRR